MACLMQGSGIAGIDMASARIKMNEDGSFNLLMGATDLGTGQRHGARADRRASVGRDHG